MQKILVLWATPRSRSTAFEWMMRQRGDFTVYHEPFGEAWYHGTDRRTPRPNDVPPKPELSYASVWCRLRADAAAQRIFMKDFPLHVLHMADAGFLDHFEHSFLIRDPAATLPSMYAKWPDFMVEETGYAEQVELFERLGDRQGHPPPVIDADDLVDDPEATVRAYCAAVGIAFMPSALSWNPGERREVSWYDGGSWHDNLKASRGLTPQKRDDYPSVDANDHLRRAYAACKPQYDAMRRYRLTANADSRSAGRQGA